MNNKTTAVVEDAAFLAETGEGPERAARRLGYPRWDSLAEVLRRAGRGDVAARLYANAARLGAVRQGVVR